MTSTIVRSPYPDVTVPEVSLPALVFAGAAEHAAKPALIDGTSGRAITYRELVGGARLAADLEEACGKRLGCLTGQGYGLTETSPVLTAHPSDEARIRHGSAGQLVPNTEAKVVDPATGRRWAATRTASCASAARR